MKTPISICIPAYNEESNIEKILTGLVNQVTNQVKISQIIVVSSACVDQTNQIVSSFCQKYPHISLHKQKERRGKADAINAFLKMTSDPIIVIQSADTIPQSDTIENLCLPLINDPTIGLTGGAPIPVNNPNNFLGYIIHTWWWFHRHIPRFGEIIAFRNILPQISSTTAVDEAYIQAKIIQLKYKAVHVDTAIVRNKGAENVSDLIKQRRRVFNGHARLLRDENIKIDSMTKSSLKLLLFKYQIHSPKELIWLFGGVCLEVYALFLGMYDMKIAHKNPFVWDTAISTKLLRKVRLRF